MTRRKKTRWSLVAGFLAQAGLFVWHYEPQVRDLMAESNRRQEVLRTIRDRQLAALDAPTLPTAPTAGCAQAVR